jgi:hypothetical protein
MMLTNTGIRSAAQALEVMTYVTVIKVIIKIFKCVTADLRRNFEFCLQPNPHYANLLHSMVFCKYEIKKLIWDAFVKATGKSPHAIFIFKKNAPDVDFRGIGNRFIVSPTLSARRSLNASETYSLRMMCSQ